MDMCALTEATNVVRKAIPIENFIFGEEKRCLWYVFGKKILYFIRGLERSFLLAC